MRNFAILGAGWIADVMAKTLAGMKEEVNAYAVASRSLEKAQKFATDHDFEKTIIMSSVDRAQKFVKSSEYKDLKKDLDSRVSQVQNEIAIAAFIDNVNIRGRVIEYLITDNGCGTH